MKSTKATRPRPFRPDSPPVIPYPPSASDQIYLSLYGRSLYPSSPTGFENAIKSYRSLCTSIAEELVQLIGESLSPRPELFTSLFVSEDGEMTPPYARLKLVQYPPVEEGEKGFGVGPHRDGGGEHVLLQSCLA